MSPDVARRRALLTVALGFVLLDTRGKPAPAEVQAVRRPLDNWQGVGHVVTGMNRQGYRLHLTNMDEEAWRATFSRAPLLAEDGFGAVQVAAWEAANQRTVGVHSVPRLGARRPQTRATRC